MGVGLSLSQVNRIALCVLLPQSITHIEKRTQPYAAIGWCRYTIYQWVEHDGGATRIMSLVLLIWVIYQNIFLYRARNSEEKLLKLPLMAPYRMQQLRMADDVARAETEERLAQMHAENGDGNDEDGTTPVVPSSGDATARDNGGGAEDNEEEPAWAEESAEESGGGASVAPTHNGAPPESADNQPQLSAKEVAAQVRRANLAEC